jgi:disulfide bond formation protein DsbB
MRKYLPILKEQSLNVAAVCILCFSMSMGFFMEFYEGQIPCTLCFLQRICMMGTAFSLNLNVLFGVCRRYYGFALIWALLGISVALRHIALNVCKPVPSDAFFFGPYRLYTWSFLVFFLSILGIAALLCFNTKESTSARSKRKGQTYFSTTLLLIMLGVGFYSVVSKQGWVF